MNLTLKKAIDKYKWVLRLIEVVAVLAALFFVAKQTSQMSDSITLIQRGFELERGEAVQAHFEKINDVLIQNPDLAKEFDLNKRDVLAYMLISDYERIYILNKKGLIDANRWRAFVIIMQQTLQRKWVVDVWSRLPDEEKGYSEDFVIFVNNLIKSE